MTARSKDAALWLAEQAGLLRARRIGELDAENLAKELEALVRRLELEIEERLAAIMTMMVRTVYDRARRPQDKMKIHRARIREIVRDSPSLRTRLEDPATQRTGYPGGCRAIDLEIP